MGSPISHLLNLQECVNACFAPLRSCFSSRTFPHTPMWPWQFRAVSTQVESGQIQSGWQAQDLHAVEMAKSQGRALPRIFETKVTPPSHRGNTTRRPSLTQPASSASFRPKGAVHSRDMRFKANMSGIRSFAAYWGGADVAVAKFHQTQRNQGKSRELLGYI